MRGLVFIVFFYVIFNSNQPLEAAKHQYFVGSSAFMLANLDEEEEDPPHFYQLNLGMRLDKNQSVSVELISWRYYAPLGIPYGTSLGKEENKFPGHVRARGVGIAYQYIFENDLYMALHAQWMNQEFRDENDLKLGSGDQLFLTARIGYRFKFFSEKMFLEPNLAITHWPTNTNLPVSFQEQEDKWPNYFLFEPGLHLGINF